MYKSWMSWERFWDHVNERNYPEAKADLRHYDTVFDAQPTIPELPTRDLLNILENNNGLMICERVRTEILKRCNDPPPFIPKMAKEEYISSRRKMIQALIAIDDNKYIQNINTCKCIQDEIVPNSTNSRWTRFMSNICMRVESRQI